MYRLLVALSLVLAMPPAFAQDKGKTDKASPKQQAQQARMKECSREAGEKNLKGEERKKFMSQCLSIK